MTVKIAVLLLIPVAGRLVEQNDAFLGVDVASKWHAIQDGHAPVVPLLHEILPHALIQTFNGTFNENSVGQLQSREVALSDPALKAAVAAKTIPPWVRGLGAFIVVGCLVLIYFMALKEEKEEASVRDEVAAGGDGQLVEKVSRGPSCPELDNAMANDLNVVDLVKASAKARPKKGAILDPDGSIVLTYGDMIARTEALARALLDGGLTTGDIVALIFKPSPPLIVATLGIMDAKMVFAPLDADAPAAWRAGQLSHIGARLQLAAEDQTSLLLSEKPSVPVWGLDATGRVVSGQGQGPPLPGRSSMAMPDDSAIIFHTSGSTGRPKPILYGHLMVTHTVVTFKNRSRMDESTVALHKSSPTWAVVLFELHPALVAGGSIVADWQCQRNLPQLARVLLERKINVLITSSPVLRLLIDDYWTSDADIIGGRPTSLRHVENVGSGIPLELCQSVCQTLANDVEVQNSYAPTETAPTVWAYSTANSVPKSFKGLKVFAPAGQPDCGVQVYLLNPELNEVETGQTGEICIAGLFMATGYLGDEASTKQKFLPNPFGEGRMYRTGDVGRWVQDPANPSRSALQVSGRVDRQTNINGLRVAPEDVEAIIRKVPGVGEVAVVVGEAEGQMKCLVACVAPAAGGKQQLEDPIKAYCTEQSPKHMRPEFVMQMAELPRLTNGKVDMKLLCQQASETVSSSDNSAPDSLGLIRKVGKEAINELDTMSAARGVGILPVLLFHWYYMPIAWYHPEVVTRQFAYPSVLFINIGVGMNWSMQLFVLTSAFQDRAAAELRRSGEWRGDLLVVILLVIMHGPIPQLLELLCWAGHGFQVPLSSIHVDAQTGVRWYLYYFLICRAISSLIFGPCMSALKRGGEFFVAIGSTLMVLLWFAIAWIGENKTSDGRLWWEVPTACPGFAQNSSWVWAISWLLPGTNGSSSSDVAYCPLLPHQTFLWYLAIYAAGWWYSASIVKWFKAHTPNVFPAFAVVGFLLVLYFFYYLEQYQALTTAWSEPDASTWCLIYLVDLCIASSLIFTLSFAIRGRWLHNTGLVFMGRYSLGTYILHVYMFGALGFLSAANDSAVIKIPEMVDGIHFVESWPGASYGLPQLLVLLAYPVLFMLTLGPLFQIGCVSAYNYSFKAIETAAKKYL